MKTKVLGSWRFTANSSPAPVLPARTGEDSSDVRVGDNSPGTIVALSLPLVGYLIFLLLGGRLLWGHWAQRSHHGVGLSLRYDRTAYGILINSDLEVMITGIEQIEFYTIRSNRRITLLESAHFT